MKVREGMSGFSPYLEFLHVLETLGMIFVLTWLFPQGFGPLGSKRIGL